MSSRLRVLTGVLTTALLAVAGGMALGEGWPVMGGILLLLGGYRAWLLSLQIRAIRAHEAED